MPLGCAAGSLLIAALVLMLANVGLAARLVLLLAMLVSGCCCWWSLPFWPLMRYTTHCTPHTGILAYWVRCHTTHWHVGKLPQYTSDAYTPRRTHVRRCQLPLYPLHRPARCTASTRYSTYCMRHVPTPSSEYLLKGPCIAHARVGALPIGWAGLRSSIAVGEDVGHVDEQKT